MEDLINTLINLESINANENNLNIFIDEINNLSKSNTSKKDDMIYRYNLVNKILLLLNKKLIIPYIKPFNLLINKSVAIVGNSRSNLNDEYGKNIDNHDEIIRFNWAVTKNYEKYVGSKETIRISNIECHMGKQHIRQPNGLILDYNLYQKLKNINFIIINPVKYWEINEMKLIAHQNNIDINNNNFYSIFYNAELFNKILKQLNIPYEFENSMNKLPQIGLGIVLIFCSLGYKPNLYGFDLSFCENNLGYYWTNIKQTEISPWHDHTLEHNILKYLQDNNYIKIY